MYYISVKGDFELLLTTSRKAAANHAGVHVRTITRHFHKYGRYEGDGCYVLVTDFLHKQRKGGGVSGGRFGKR